MDESDLIEKLGKIERLFAGAGSAGEKEAAAQAMGRIKSRLAELAQREKSVEYSFSLRDSWNVRLFVALVRRYGLRPFRYPRQRKTTVMVRGPKSFVDQTLWPEYLELEKVLSSYLSQVTTRVISQAIDADVSDAQEEADPQRLPGESR
jgi:hypothetical protein